MIEFAFSRFCLPTVLYNCSSCWSLNSWSSPVKEIIKYSKRSRKKAIRIKVIHLMMSLSDFDWNLCEIHEMWICNIYLSFTILFFNFFSLNFSKLFWKVATYELWTPFRYLWIIALKFCVTGWNWSTHSFKKELSVTRASFHPHALRIYIPLKRVSSDLNDLIDCWSKMATLSA